MAAPIAISSNPIDLRNGSTPRSVNIYTVPTGYVMVLDSLDVVSVSVTNAGTPAVVEFGHAGNASAYEATHQQFGFAYLGSAAPEPQTVAAGTVITATITTNSAATAESGIVVVNGYLLVGSGSTPNPPAPPAPGGYYAYFYAVDPGGNIESGITINYALCLPPSGSGIGYDSSPHTVTSDGSGLVQFEIVPGATYKFWSGLAAPVLVAIPASPANPYPLPDWTFSS
jgi:hypothetical protein